MKIVTLIVGAVLFIGSIFCPRIGWCGELKIVDASGLPRAFKKISSIANVVAQVRSFEPGLTVSLVNVDGLAQDIAADLNERQFVFRGVKDGVWRIVTKPTVEVLEVRIE